MDDERTDRVTRRSFIEKAGIATLGTASLAASAIPADSSKGRHSPAQTTYYATQRLVQEWSFISGKAYTDPFNQVELDVIFTDPRGKEHRMPAFWAGEQTWKVRFGAASLGKHAFRTVSSDATNSDLHERRGGNRSLRI